jgi:hypothetical protein
MRTLKEKLVERLIEGSDDIFTEFVVVGLEESLTVIINEITRLVNKPKLSDIEHTDLNSLYHDGKATITVLQYYTADDYLIERKIINSAWDKLMSEVF